MTALRSRARALVLALAATLLLSGCDFSVYSLPLPGGPDTGDDPMTIQVEFTDVLDLVPQSTVKVNDVTVGKVTDIALDGWTALVTLELRDGTRLPDNTTAQLRQTSLLGEKFVSLEAPAGDEASQNLLGDGDTIPLERTGRNPEVEEVLGALSLLLNGGGVAQLKTISSELNAALEGREGTARSVLRQIRLLVTQLDDDKADIVAALEGLDRLSRTANGQIDDIDAALEELPSALETIDAQRDDLVTMLEALDRLSNVGVRVIRASKASTIDALEQLQPVLSQLAATGDDFARSFHVFLTYPFVDEVVGRDPQVARNLHMGDYTNLSVQLDLRVPEIDLPEPPLPDDPLAPVCQTLDDVREEVDDRFGDSPVRLDRLLEYLDGIDDLCDGARRALDRCLSRDDISRVAACLGRTLEVTVRDLTQGTIDNTCEILGIPDNRCPQLPDGDGGGDGPLPPLPVPTDPIDLPRPGFGSVEPPGGGVPGGPTLGQLRDAYDPALVSLLVPGMVNR